MLLKVFYINEDCIEWLLTTIMSYFITLLSLVTLLYKTRKIYVSKLR